MLEELKSNFIRITRDHLPLEALNDYIRLVTTQKNDASRGERIKRILLTKH